MSWNDQLPVQLHTGVRTALRQNKNRFVGGGDGTDGLDDSPVFSRQSTVIDFGARSPTTGDGQAV
jgi:hypothetical protein